jgi:hypothetical protein
MVQLKKGHLYRLVYKLQSGNYRWYKYEATMTYLGPGRFEEFFNLRPLAGTQSLPKNSILEAEDLGESHGRDDSRHRLKRSLGPIPKEK